MYYNVVYIQYGHVCGTQCPDAMLGCRVVLLPWLLCAVGAVICSAFTGGGGGVGVGVWVCVCGFVLGPNSNDFANQILVMSGALVFHSLFFIGE